MARDDAREGADHGPGARRQRLRHLVLWVLLGAGYCGLAVAWTMASPPGAPPDETGHYVKAVAAGRFDLRGQPRPAVEQPVSDAEAWVIRTSRLFDMPRELSPSRYACEDVPDSDPAVCRGPGHPLPPGGETLTHVGTYQPWAYVLPGLATRGADEAATALRRARGANVVLCLALVVVAGLLLGDRARLALSLIGLPLAVTPMVLYLGASLSPSGTEISAAICYWAALLRLSRPGRAPAWVWGALAASGAVLVLGRSLGPAWAALAVLVVVVLIGPRPTRQRFREGGRASRLALIVIGVGCVASALWELAFQPHAGLDTSIVAESLRPSTQALPALFEEFVGVFGPITIRMRQSAYWAWGALVAGLIVSSLVLGRRRERTAMALLLVLCPVITVFLAVAVVQQTGFGMQARYVAPLLVAVPLLAGEVAFRNRERIPRTASAAVMGVVVLAVASVQLLGWHVNARRYAVGIDGPRLFLGTAAWSPPGGWWPWLALAVAGAGALVAFGAVAAAEELRGTPAGRARRLFPTPDGHRSATPWQGSPVAREPSPDG